MDLERIRIAVVMDPEKGKGHLFSCSETRVRHVKLQYSSPSPCIPFLYFFFFLLSFPFLFCLGFKLDCTEYLPALGPDSARSNGTLDAESEM
jgi:hypothetical protein